MKKSSQKTQFILVLSTTNSLQSAKKIATFLVKEKLVACVNIIPKIQSIYSWKKKICKETEFLIILKTRKNLYSKLEKRFQELHPYEVPEIISFPIAHGSKNYLHWILKETL